MLGGGGGRFPPLGVVVDSSLVAADVKVLEGDVVPNRKARVVHDGSEATAISAAIDDHLLLALTFAVSGHGQVTGNDAKLSEALVERVVTSGRKHDVSIVAFSEGFKRGAKVARGRSLGHAVAVDRIFVQVDNDVDARGR
jgi:hypothetical protein